MATASPSLAEPSPNYNMVMHFDYACIVTVTFFMALRLYVRRCMVRSVWGDDWLLLAGTVLFVVDTSIDAAGWRLLQRSGVEEGTPQYALMNNIAIFLYLMSEVLVRGAYAFFYLRVLPQNLNLAWQRYTIMIVVSVYGIFQGGNAFLYLFQCGNPANLGRPTAKCVAPNILAGLFSASYYFDAVLDWLMALMPSLVVYKSMMSVRTKWSVAFILLLGCCASGVSVAVIYLSHMQGVNDSSYATMNEAILIDMLATSELMVAIVCLSLAALRPLFKGLSDKVRPSESAPSQQTMFSSTAQQEEKKPVESMVFLVDEREYSDV